MMKLRSKKSCKSNSKLSNGGGSGGSGGSGGLAGSGFSGGNDIKWELRPGGMLVQKREDGGSEVEMITVRVLMGSQWHDISIEATSTFGELKMILSLVTSLEPKEQRLLFRGKEREDGDYLHMLGVKDMDKVLLLEDPAIKDKKKLHALTIGKTCRTISV